ncbi:MAG TPA: DUF4157 domain-containing protein [Longimicrobium sp.]|nr:DUF4157 domain-containing protein [Longimicrobium sp.]
MLAPARPHRPALHPSAPLPARAIAPAPPAPSPVPEAAPAAHDFARVSVHPTPVRLQATLEIGAADDPHEREAERVADQVMRTGGGEVHADARGVLRRCSCGGACPACRAKGRKRKEELARAPEGGGPALGTGAAPPAVHDVLRGPGHPLDAGAAAFLEPRFGHSFERVRVHTDARAAASAKAVGARAYTVGRHVVFGAGQYRPESAEGRRLLAHELAHVLQQDTGAVLRRDPPPDAPDTDPAQAQASATPARTPIEGPRLEVTKKTSPYACLVFIHNDERNARLTARLLHQHCAYNLAMIEPDHRSREVEVAGEGKIDPNALFPPDIVRECLPHPAGCEREVDDHAAKPTRPSTQKQFFMAVRDCSEDFSLPVVALHNNRIRDTQALLETKGTITRRDKQTKKRVPVDPFEDLPRDVENRPPRPKGWVEPAEEAEVPPDSVEKMKEVLKRHFEIKELAETRGKTNIFRWCAGPDITRCHIGDPHHPDNLVWVTNPRDFERVRDGQPDANVVLQGGVGPESENDLSTLFLTLERIARQDHGLRALLFRLAQEALAGLDALAAVRGAEGARQVLEMLARRADAERAAHLRLAAAEAAGLRYVNIETPDTAPGIKGEGQRAAHRVAQYEAVVRTLAALDLHYCGEDDAASDADAAIRSGVAAGEPKRKSKKKSRKEEPEEKSEDAPAP